MGNEYGSKQPVGCQFNLSVMSDDFVDVILSALEETETAEVMMVTDDVSSSVHGPISEVFAVVESIYLNAAQTGKHVAMSGTFSVGCPETHEENDLETPTGSTAPRRGVAQQAGCKFALYPLGTEDYMEIIQSRINAAAKEGVKVSASHGATRLDGDVHDIFNALESAFLKVQEAAGHTAMTFTLSSNSPSNR
ncbi:HMP/thiamine ABC transporter substrate-binding protein ThiU [Salinicoccus jeotgali]|uniref:HMP/thiamine ABC transporter substrate-binding protein ThiU n=1 Tax=Salinicoccus jeotgali TaxID=381634 RepID=A0ABP7F564_9STAP